jgi:uncharacterized membrane protein
MLIHRNAQGAIATAAGGAGLLPVPVVEREQQLRRHDHGDDGDNDGNERPRIHWIKYASAQRRRPARLLRMTGLRYDRHMTATGIAADRAPQLINWWNLRWVALALAVMVAAILVGNAFFLNFVHVMSGVMWTGIDIFMGFVLGPVLRQADVPARRAIAVRLIPRMLFLMPTLAIITGTAGYFLAQQLGFLDVAYPAHLWVDAALALIALLTVQGLGVLLPTNLLVCFEMQKPQPNPERIKRLMRRYVHHTALQGAMQIAIIVVMAKFVTGI